ncbi:hypothetical protein [Duganella sp. Root198D2]|uniref:hypothetical protein n=1 Tax=Duganella sp. Root198D2 TaxID=1736489 RepID=UPI00070E18F1|nr:hypothetical protein [Duganella sp. Root198D2]KRB87189.1 hypothetical protein ASE26_07285 [Duganella sp. Root198D2]
MRWWKTLLLTTATIFVEACSHQDEITPRGYVLMIDGGLQQQRKAIAKALLGDKKVAIAGPLVWADDGTKTNAVPDYGWITATGAIIVQSEKYGVLLIEEPTIIEGKVAWSCVVYPA